MSVVELGAVARDGLLQAGIRQAEEAIRSGAPLGMVLAHLTSTVEELAEHRVVASILVLDVEGLLRNGASPNLPADYLIAIDRIKPDPELGTCAAAAATGKTVFTPDFTDDARWAELRHLPLSIGFVGAWSLPIKSVSGRVLGTFGTYFRERRRPEPAEVEAVQALARVAARAIEARG